MRKPHVVTAPIFGAPAPYRFVVIDPADESLSIGVESDDDLLRILHDLHAEKVSYECKVTEWPELHALMETFRAVRRAADA